MTKTTAHTAASRRNLALRLIWIVYALALVVFGNSAVGVAMSLRSTASPTPSSPPIIPITILSGFLGAGKTSLLQNMLENNQGLKIALIVNDVASVNIDSKLLSPSSSGNRNTNKNNQGASFTAAAAGVIELQNGCACCSKSDELLASVSDLVTLSDLRGESSEGLSSNNNNNAFDHIVVEMSGVADPRSIRAKFQEAAFYDMPLLDRVRLDTMVTVIDCNDYLDYLASGKTATLKEAPELFYPDGVIPSAAEDGIDGDDSWDNVPLALRELLMAEGASNSVNPWEDLEDGMASREGVADLLVSQTETADVLILNKVDLVNKEGLEQVESIVHALNARALSVIRCKYGNVPLEDVLAVAKGAGVVEAGMIDDHRDAVTAVEEAVVVSSAVECKDPECTDSSHSHDHVHSHAHEDHSKSISVSSAEAETTSDHSHAHAHDHDAAAVSVASACQDSECTDTSHSHTHSHSSDTQYQQEPQHAGIGTFVYRARRPFHPERLLAFLRLLPLKRGLPDESELDNRVSDEKIVASDDAKKILARVIRSKGFSWCADSDLGAMYWSHAGSSFELGCLGSWWATLARSQWPPEAMDAILVDFDDVNHDESDTSYSSVGDRRQEIVFIGPTLANAANQAEIESTLNQCLLNDEEWKEYCKLKSKDTELRARFKNPIDARMLSF